MATKVKTPASKSASRAKADTSWELKYWSEKLGVSEPELARAVKAVGSKAAAAPADNASKPTYVLDDARASKSLRVQFGNVVVTVSVPSDKDIIKRVMESRRAVGRLKKVIATPGVKLDTKPTTPTYTADPRNPDLVVRKIGTQVVRGRFLNGQFVEVA